MDTVSRRRFIAVVAGAAVLSGCGVATVAPSTPGPTASDATAAATQDAPSTGATPSPAMEAAASLAAGQGEVVTVGGQAVAIYKDPQGQVALLSPRCPHMGCQVAWNPSASTWDCPCHGSRFNADGSLKHGPATKGLSPASA